MEYLLNAAHPDNGGKAAFFLALGFRTDDWMTMSASFQEMALHTAVTASVQSVHGQKYVVEGELNTPSGKRPRVRSVWIVDATTLVPRLVTAYPKP